MFPIAHEIHLSRPFRRGLPRTMLAALFLFSVGAVFAASPLTVSLSSEASRPAANDLMQATLFAEAAGAAPEELSGRINRTVAEALKLAQTYPSVKVQSGNANTYPVYAENGGAIESWRMRSEISLESGDAPALSELVGKLQASLAISSLRLLPSPETKRKAEDAAILDAIALFEARAKLLADARGKNYAIKELSIATGGSFAPAPMLRAVRADFAKSAPMPIESGESQVSATVSGKIEIE
ncbi:MAG: SIMPL domain-containing protein [Planctomycetota bacterium]|jgi:predicted secreted protein|nr:SIMPL domain-containing protein [Planctomycetota bacterium]